MASSYSTRVIGGAPAAATEWAATVQLFSTSGQGSASFFCAGTLLAEDWVLTAAHCLSDVSASNLYVAVGGNGILGTGDYLPVSRIYVHEQFDTRSSTNDIALILLQRPASGVAPIEVYNGSPGVGCVASVAGWGTTSHLGTTLPSQLVSATLPVVGFDACRSTMGPYVTRNSICAGDIQGGSGACTGDSGGPLAMYQGGKLRQMGIVSWGGPECGAANQYGVYTRVANYVGWIDQIIGGSADSVLGSEAGICQGTGSSTASTQGTDEGIGSLNGLFLALLAELAAGARRLGRRPGN